MFYKVEYPEMQDSYYITPRGRTNKISNEPDAVEAPKIDRALESFVSHGFLPTATYDHARFHALRQAVRQNYQITWTTITPPMERLIYAINAIKQPRNVLCIGVFCGNTVTWNVGAASGPGKCYTAQRLTGVEIAAEPAALARRNLASIGMDDVDILCEDGFVTIDRVDYPIDLLYLDANGYDPESGINNTKRIYYSMVKRALPKLAPGAVVIAHDTNTESFLRSAQVYLDYVRDSTNFQASFSIEIDEEGLEVSFLPGT